MGCDCGRGCYNMQTNVGSGVTTETQVKVLNHVAQDEVYRAQKRGGGTEVRMLQQRLRSYGILLPVHHGMGCYNMGSLDTRVLVQEGSRR